jgi:galactokinase
VPIAHAPGRVNLIGDHTDYQDGWCLPMAVDRELRISFDAAEVTHVPDVAHEWLEALGETPAFAASVESSIPVGAGLSSSAALAVALCIARARLRGEQLAGRELALAAQALEQRATGVPCGVMDQMASVFGTAGHALLLDCRSLEVEPVPLPSDATVVVIHSGVTRHLAGGEYATRRAACEAAATRLALPSLRDATRSQVADDPFARHVVSENARVLAFADALRANDMQQCGALMLHSHASLRDDFKVSTPELDDLVERAVAHGAYGARLTGAGFGGCIVAIVAAARADALAADLEGWVVHAAAGAGMIE